MEKDSKMSSSLILLRHHDNLQCPFCYLINNRKLKIHTSINSLSNHFTKTHTEIDSQKMLLIKQQVKEFLNQDKTTSFLQYLIDRELI